MRIHSWNHTYARVVAHELGMSCFAKNNLSLSINNKASSAYRHVSEPFGAACPEFAFAYEFALQLSTMSLLLHGFVP